MNKSVNISVSKVVIKEVSMSQKLEPNSSCTSSIESHSKSMNEKTLALMVPHEPMKNIKKQSLNVLQHPQNFIQFSSQIQQLHSSNKVNGKRQLKQLIGAANEKALERRAFAYSNISEKYENGIEDYKQLQESLPKRHGEFERKISEINEKINRRNDAMKADIMEKLKG
uniref:DUF148 domain-containing protein n=1 Tax=Caenorhabditis tropicalis TaxID=1561998 RepID=A0A1I7SYI3_9PELO